MLWVLMNLLVLLLVLALEPLLVLPWVMQLVLLELLLFQEGGRMEVEDP